MKYTLEKNDENIFRRFFQMLNDCEAIQRSKESDYTKERAKITAYDEILDIFNFVYEEDKE